MILRAMLLVVLFVSTAQASQLTDEVSNLLLKRRFEEAKAVVLAGQQNNSVEMDSRDFIAAVTNVSSFYQNFDKWREMFEEFASKQELVDFYEEHLATDLRLLTEKPLPFNRELVMNLNEKMKSATLNYNNYMNGLNREEQQARREEARAKEIEKVKAAKVAKAEEARSKISVTIKGATKRCNDLPEMKQAAEQGLNEYFSGWHLLDFDAASSLQQQCEDQWGEVFSKLKNEAVDQLNKVLIERQRAEESCHSQKKYLLYLAQENITEYLDALAGWEANRARERRISKESGVRNLAAEYMNGVRVVELKEAVQEEWIIYKKLGGKASTPKAVKHALKNPCEVLEAETESANLMLLE